ncbi:integrase core domain-containing protein [Jhaorihella thermophila]
MLPPRSPEMNGRVERMQATWRYEFYAVYDPPHRIAEFNPLIDAFAHRYNTHRPPTMFLARNQPCITSSTTIRRTPLKAARASRMS